MISLLKTIPDNEIKNLGLTNYTDVESFVESAAFFEIEPQDLVYDELDDFYKDTLSDLGFRLIILKEFIDTKVSDEPLENISETLKESVISDKESSEINNSKSSDDVLSNSIDSEQYIIESSLSTEPVVSESVKDEFIKTDIEENKKEEGTVLSPDNSTLNTEEQEEKLEEVSVTSIEKQTSSDSETSEPKKTSFFFSKLFGKKQTKVENLDSSTFNKLKRFRKDLNRGDDFREYLLSENLLTKEQIESVNKEIERQRSFGNKIYFIQTARELGLLSEKDAARVLSKATNTEIVPLDTLDFAMIKMFNRKLEGSVSSYVIWKVDNANRKVVILKDLATTEYNLEKLETFYINYDIIVMNLIDGSIKKIFKKIGR